MTTHIQLKPLTTSCDHLQPFTTTYDYLWPLTTTFDHLWPLMTSYNLLRPLRTNNDIFDLILKNLLFQPFTTTYNQMTISNQSQHLGPLMTTYNHSPQLTTNYQYLSPLTTFYLHIQLCTAYRIYDMVWLRWFKTLHMLSDVAGCHVTANKGWFGSEKVFGRNFVCWTFLGVRIFFDLFFAKIPAGPAAGRWWNGGM